MACSGSFTNDEIKGRIKNICTKFVSAVEPDRLSDWLVQENVINIDQWQRIQNFNYTRESRCRGLLYHLFSIPHPRAFLVVRQALVEENHYLLELIDNQEPGSGISSLPDIQTSLQDTEKTEHQEKDFEDQKRAWEDEKDRLLKMLRDHEDQKKALEEENDRLLKMQNDLETKLQLASIEQQKLEQDRKLWCKEKEQLLEQIHELQQYLGMDVPANWETMRNDEDFKRIQLKTSDQEYKDVAKAVLSTAQTTVNQIVKIERIQNKVLYKQYVVRKAAMDEANPGFQNEMTLWHGTSADALESINRTGFKRDYCAKHVVYGRGVYFVKHFSLSAQNTYSPSDVNGCKHVYQCKVLTGDYTVGNQSMTNPPPKSGNAVIRYDSTVDNVVYPSIFVIYYDSQAYPQYLIYFK